MSAATTSDPFKLALWARTQKKASRFVLARVVKLETDEQLSAVTEWEAPLTDVEATIDECRSLAMADASAFPGRASTYVIQALAGDRVLGSRRFLVRGEETSSGMPTEAPTQTGVAAMLMRHLEFQAKLNAEAKLSVIEDAKVLVQMYQDVIRDCRTENMQLRGRERETVELFTRLKSDANQFELKRAEVEAESKAGAESRGRFWSIATPVLLSRLGAAPAPPILPPAPPSSSGAGAAPSNERSGAPADEVIDEVALDLMASLARSQIPVDTLLAGAPPEMHEAFHRYVAKYAPELRRRAAPPAESPTVTVTTKE